MKKTIALFILPFLALCLSLSACIEDSFTTSPSDQPVFSTDTISLGVVFTEEPTATSRMLVYNPHSKSLNISRIGISGENADCFRVNVDGISAREFSDIEIRGKDSIFVFVEATLPQVDGNTPVEVSASLDFTANGVMRSVVLSAEGQNVRRLRAVTFADDTRLDNSIPYQVYDSLVVAPGATLTIPEGTRLCFHDKAMLIVRGTLLCEGTPEKRVVLEGDRTGMLVGDVSFEIMSRQWQGAAFAETSQDNVLTNTDIKNTVQGVAVYGTGAAERPQLTLIDCRLRNSAFSVLEAYHSNILAAGCEFAEAADGLVYLQGGRGTFNHCTFANYYLYAVISRPAISFGHISADEKTGFDDGSGLPYLAAEFSNSIIYGLGNTLSHGDLTDTDVYFRRCLFKGEGTDDEHFIESLWDADPLYYTVREEYHFDYRLKPESPAIGAADQALTLPEAAFDIYGLPRGPKPDLGAYVYTEPEKE